MTGRLQPRPRHPLRVDVVTLFPEMFPGPLGHSLAGRALQSLSAQIGELGNSVDVLARGIAGLPELGQWMIGQLDDPGVQLPLMCFVRAGIDRANDPGMGVIRHVDAGYDEASLDVDSENPTGALGIYRRAGFEVEKRFTDYIVTVAPEGSPGP